METSISKPLKILVTGGAGFIGSNFVKKTLQSRPNVYITVLDSFTYASRRSNLDATNGKLSIIKGDILDASLVDKLTAESDLVVHFAAESHNDKALVNPLPFVETNILGTYNLLQSCVKYGVRFHHISTDEVFGDLPLEGADKFTAASAFNPSSPYSSTKASSDLLVKAWVRSFGLRATISNCGNNYGPYQHEEKLIPKTILLAASGIRPKVYGNGQNVRDWIHVDDHNDGVWTIIEKGQLGKTYLLGASCERSNLEVVRAILRELDVREDFFEFVSDRPGHDIRYAVDASRTKEELGWEPKYRSFEDGLKSVVAHYREIAIRGKIDVSKIAGLRQKDMI